MNDPTAIVGIITALSIASERLVEIIQGFVPILNVKQTDPKKEARRRAVLQLLAVGSGIATAFLAQDYLPPEMNIASNNWNILGLGLLASGGSGFWHTVLTYFAKVKDIKTLEAEAIKRASQE
ncbi:MAG: hypothetical protein ACPGVO_18530 [Spirulinaceae cyanobacterium]